MGKGSRLVGDSLKHDTKATFSMRTAENYSYPKLSWYFFLREKTQNFLKVCDTMDMT